MKNSSWIIRPYTIPIAGVCLVSLIVAVFAIIGCGSTTDSESLLTGIFVDDVVEGMEYRAGKRIGYTDSNGKFYYKEIETVEFYIGGVKIGETDEAKELTTPIDLVDEDNSFVLHPTVTNICRFLQSLDEDLDPANGIKINAETRDRIQLLVDGGMTINFAQDETDFTNEISSTGLFDALNTDPTVYVPDTGGNPQVGVLVSKTDANNHFFKSLATRLATPIMMVNIGDSLTTGAQSGIRNYYSATQNNGYAYYTAYQAFLLAEADNNWHLPLLTVLAEEDDDYGAATDFEKTLFRIVDDEDDVNEDGYDYLTPYNLGVPGATIKSVIDDRTSGEEYDDMTELFRPIPEIVGAAQDPAVERVEVSQLEAALFLSNMDENKNRLKIFTLWIGAEDTLGIVTQNLGEDLSTDYINAFLTDTTAGHDIASVTANLTYIVDQLRNVEYAKVFIATIPHVESLGTVFSRDDIQRMAEPMAAIADPAYTVDLDASGMTNQLIGFKPFVGDLVNPDPDDTEHPSISRALAPDQIGDKLNTNIAAVLTDDANYLDQTEINTINARIDAINALIEGFATAYDNVYLVDVKTEIYDKLTTEDGYDLRVLKRENDNFPEDEEAEEDYEDDYGVSLNLYKKMSGGFYTFDGFHPGNTGYAAIAFTFMNKIQEAGIGLDINATYEYLGEEYPALDVTITDYQVLDPYAYDEDGDGFMIALPVSDLFAFHSYDAKTMGGWVDCGADIPDDPETPEDDGEYIQPYYVGGLQGEPDDDLNDPDDPDTPTIIDFWDCNGYMPAYEVE